MARYRHKPTETEAARFNNSALKKDAPPGVYFDQNERPYVITIHGAITHIAPGDYIVREPDGVHYYPCKPDIFESHYELVEAES